MKHKIVLVLVTLVMISMLFAACAAETPTAKEPTTPSAPETPSMVTPTAPPTTAPPTTTPTTPVAGLVKDSLGRMVEKPQYGGNLVIALTTDPKSFDEGILHVTNCPTLHLTNEELLTGNWIMGNSGTQQWDFRIQNETPYTVKWGRIAESFEIVDDYTVVYHIRPGIKWQNKAPYGSWSGRELTADDVAYSLIRAWTYPTAYLKVSFPFDKNYESITANDKYTVTLKTKTLAATARCAVLLGGDHVKMIAKDAAEYFDNFGDWRNEIGTGPYMLTEYVPGSVAHLDRNPNYWATDPFFPDNQLPYPDSVDMVIIPDISTRLAGIRTGKIDQLGGRYTQVNWEDAESLIKSNPNLKYTQYFQDQPLLFYKVNDPSLPTYKTEVRQALGMAIDFKAILEGYYNGQGEFLTWPVPPYVGWDKIGYKAPETMSQLVQDILGHNPDKAKQLLADAGYPNGFSAQVNTVETGADMLSLVQEYWSAINVDLKINVMEPGAFTSMVNARSQPDMVFDLHGSGGTQLLQVSKDVQWNWGGINDPVIEEAKPRLEAQLDLMDKIGVAGETMERSLEQQWITPFPAPYIYTVWQPWVKAYSGENTPGITNDNMWAYYVWVDAAMKKAAAGK